MYDTTNIITCFTGMIQNRSGVLVSAEAVQTIAQLMGEQELYNYHQGTFAVSSMDWTQD